MRRSFGPMGGGGTGGMMKTVHRAIRAGSGSSQQPFSHSHNNPPSNNLSFSSDHHHHPYPSSSLNQYDDFVFISTVPSMDEVHHAISSLQQVVNPPPSSQDSGWDFDWIEPSTSMLNAHSGGSESVYDAFRLLQTEPSVKKMVMSLSSDKSVWEAVMNNEAVRELRDSVYQGQKSQVDTVVFVISAASKSILGDEVESSDGPTPVADVLQWIFINTKSKLVEIVKKATEMVSMLFLSPRNEKAKDQEGAETEPFEKIVTSSFFLSVMVLLIVVVTRSCKYD